MMVALSSVVLYVVVIVQRALVGGFVEGIKAVWDRDILEFFLIGCICSAWACLANTSDASITRCAIGRAT